MVTIKHVFSVLLCSVCILNRYFKGYTASLTHSAISQLLSHGRAYLYESSLRVTWEKRKYERHLIKAVCNLQ